jgi:SAM-dependent methyltransferase
MRMFSVDQINAIRAAELQTLAPLIRPSSRIVEIGAGTGEQAKRLVELGHDVTALDLPNSTYSDDLVFPVQPYNGMRLPLSDASVDAVYSSMLLEHVRDLGRLHAEVRRVLRPGGVAIHVVPTHTWRAWTTATAMPAALFQLLTMPARRDRGWYPLIRQLAGTVLPRRHGERGNIFSETWLYHPRWWRRHFAANGFTIEREQTLGYFYTGNMLLGQRLDLKRRRWLATLVGGATHVFVLATSSPDGGARDRGSRAR